MKLNKFLAYITLSIVLVSCSEDFLEPGLTTSKDLNKASTITTASDLEAIILGAYDRMNEATYYGRDYIVFAEVRSDNAFSNGRSGRFVGPGQFFLNPTDAYPSDTWLQIYRVIANANIVINAEVDDKDEAWVQHLKGEAYAIRALAHMDLLRLYGQQYEGGTLGIPYIVRYSKDISEFTDADRFPTRNTISEVWTKIGLDLDEASTRMSPELDSNSPRRFTTMGVAALKSRYYLYIEDFNNVITEAEKVIGTNDYTIANAADFPTTWSGSGENTTLFELAFTNTDHLGNNSLYEIYQGAAYGDIEVTDDLYFLYEATDVRRNLYSRTATGVARIRGKYPDFTSSIRVIRYAEVLLNYAEALVRRGNPGDDAAALNILNTFTTNRNATAYGAATLDNVLLERRKELAMEGHRFFDLMRHGMDIPKVDAGQTFSATIPFGDGRLTFPIPQGEINSNPNMEQNEHYKQ